MTDPDLTAKAKALEALMPEVLAALDATGVNVSLSIELRRILSALEPTSGHDQWNAAIEAAVVIATDWALGPEEVAPAIRALKKE